MEPNITEPLNKILDSDDTTVGGGSASALTAAMAAGMIGMVAKLSAKKPVNLTEEDYASIAAQCDELNKKLQQGSINDMEAYGLIVDAYKLPKGTDEEKAKRSEAIQAAAKKAAEVPLENGRMAARVHELGESLKGNSNPACISDLMSALYLCSGSVKDLALNVNANLGMIKNPEVINELKDGMLELLLKAVCY